MKEILILEDNRDTLEYLRRIVQSVTADVRVYTIDNIKDAYQCAMEKSIDLFMVDIILDTNRPGDSSGLKFIDSMRKVEHYLFTPVIIITSLEDPRLYSYEKLHCYGYVEKPFDQEQVKKLVRESLKFPKKKEESKSLYFRKEGIVFAVDMDNIVYVESIRHSLFVHMDDGQVVEIPYLSMRRLTDENDMSDFVKCNRNTMVNMKFVCNVDVPNRFIQLPEGFGQVEIGVTYKKSMKEIFKLL